MPGIEFYLNNMVNIISNEKIKNDLNKGIMAEFRPQMKQYYYNPEKYKSYLEQLGIKYPTLKSQVPNKGF